MQLSNANKKKYILKSLNFDTEYNDRLFSQGFVIGKPIEVIFASRNMFIIKVMNTKYAINRNLAEKIEVQDE